MLNYLVKLPYDSQEMHVCLMAALMMAEYTRSSLCPEPGYAFSTLCPRTVVRERGKVGIGHDPPPPPKQEEEKKTRLGPNTAVLTVWPPGQQQRQQQHREPVRKANSQVLPWSR